MWGVGITVFTVNKKGLIKGLGGKYCNKSKGHGFILKVEDCAHYKVHKVKKVVECW